MRGASTSDEARWNIAYLDRHLESVIGLNVLEALGVLVGMVDDVLDRDTERHRVGSGLVNVP
ncbi:MAG: hypothetical protein NTZ21_08935 [Actinobacteria bacterium]|nr:hypothetical protein [Actinomycetota bacterium]